MRLVNRIFIFVLFSGIFSFGYVGAQEKPKEFSHGELYVLRYLSNNWIKAALEFNILDEKKANQAKEIMEGFKSEDDPKKVGSRKWGHEKENDAFEKAGKEKAKRLRRQIEVNKGRPLTAPEERRVAEVAEREEQGVRDKFNAKLALLNFKQWKIDALKIKRLKEKAEAAYAAMFNSRFTTARQERAREELKEACGAIAGLTPEILGICN